MFISRFELQDCFEIDDSYFSDNIQTNHRKDEPYFHFDESFFNINDGTDISGYFQTGKYFSHCKSKILEVLTFKSEVLEKAKNLLPKTDKELVSIHVRRGDYAIPNPFHPVVSDVYLEKSINHFNDEKYQFLVFSDDLEWCRQKWSDSDRFTFFSSDSHFVDFCAMSLCQHHIISNSSFSWWSSYLSKNENKIVIAPKKWFGTGYSSHNTSDLYTEDMIIIDETPLSQTNDVNIFTICTGKYVMFFDQFYKSCQEKFLPNKSKKYFVFTDGELPNYHNVVKVHQDKLGWPFDTMMRFKMFNSIEHLLDGEYVFFFNINMSFIQTIGEEVIPNESNDYLMGVNHPGYFNKPLNLFPYERRDVSSFYMSYVDGKFYYQGCFNGGRKKEFMEMSNQLEKLIDLDLSNEIIPVWHDETALNWFYSKKSPLILNPSYAYPESYMIPFDRKIIQLDKNKMGGHSYLRN
jgi:hypothetical protein